MNGWRGRLGLVVPSSNTTNEPEFSRTLPDGVSLHTARMRLEDAAANNLTEMADELERCVELLSTAEVDVIAYGCTTGSLVHGPGYDEEIESRIRDAAGLPAVATAAAIKRAFDAVGIESVAITTPYIGDLNRREAEFLDAAGYEVHDISGLGLKPNLEIGEQRPETAYREARLLDHEDADGVFISCTNYRTFEIIEPLERDLEKPVVTSNQATLWNAFELLGVDPPANAPGRLFDA